MLKELYGTSMLKYEDKEEILEYYILNDERDSENYNYEKSVSINDCGKIIREENNNLENRIKIYGIEVVKKSENHVEKSFISDLTVNKSFAEEILKTIKDNVVTPVHLYDVLENFL